MYKYVDRFLDGSGLVHDSEIDHVAECRGRGYPSFTQDGLEWSSIFDNNIDIGGLIDVRSEVPKASGIWKVTKVTHNLEAYTSATAAWNSTFSAVFVQNNQYS